MRGGEESTFRGARLDRAWCNRFPGAQVTHLPKAHSDHVQLLITLAPNNLRPVQKYFRFQVPWTRHETFQGTIQDGWVRDGNLLNNMAAVATRLTAWNCDTFSNIF